LLFADSTLQKVLLHTNKESANRTTKYELKISYSGKATIHELRGFIGLLHLAGVFKDGYANLKEL
jgi:hypothetical protein